MRDKLSLKKSRRKYNPQINNRGQALLKNKEGAKEETHSGQMKIHEMICSP